MNTQIRYFGSRWALASLVVVMGCTAHHPAPAAAKSANEVSSRAVASRQSDTTPFTALKKQLALRPGQTYLNFMSKQVKPALDSFNAEIHQEMNKYPKQYSRWQDDLRATGSGVAIRIDAKNYIFNIGYTDGSSPQDDVKSGRSYGVGPSNAQSDPSDIAYLKELEAYFKSKPDEMDEFYQAIMALLTNCDSSGWKGLSSEGQIVATDFVAIYTAESDRHLMVNLRPSSHPWEIDLAAATFVSAFNIASGKIMKAGQLVDGSIQDWWAKGLKGSGIGETRRDRKLLQQQLAKFMRDSGNAGDIDAIGRVIGDSDDDDIIQDVFEYLNAPSMNGKALSAANAKVLADHMVNYTKALRTQSNSFVRGGLR